VKRIILKSGEEDRVRRGHPWVYDNEVGKVLKPVSGGFAPIPPEELEPGEAADIESSRKDYLGRGFVNPHSKIIARIYSPSKEGADKGFFKRRIREAAERRSRGGYDLSRESARIVFGEADFLPGLIVDRFTGWPLEALTPPYPPDFEGVAAALGPPASWLSVQFLCYAMELRRELILDALEEVLAPAAFPSAPGLPGPALAGIIEKSAVPVRELEGLPLREGLLRGSLPPGGILIFENRLPFALRLEEGQKTGCFLDQRDNRRLAGFYTEELLRARKPGVPGSAPTGASPEGASPAGLRVLDAFSCAGGFGIHAARAGAGEVLCVDSSAAALEGVRKNAALNGVEDRVKALSEDVFEYLRSAERRRERFDLVILDPPAFAKSRSALEGALRGYKEINLRALKLLNRGGVLLSCSCSHALEEGRFRAMIASAAADAERRIHELDFRRQAPDHPVLMGYEESLYLKCGVYRVL
jgi:23S rRNA (cytosine1962-C5)-methyltransferase